MNTFENYLQKKKYRNSTIKGHLEDVRRFTAWSTARNYPVKEINYNQLLEFVQSFQKRNVSKHSINVHLNSIDKYFDYQIEQGERKLNPAKKIRLKNRHKKVLQNLFTTVEMETIYQSYLNRPIWDYRFESMRRVQKRETVLLGLLIFQGIQTAEIKKIEKSHFNLHQGTVYIPAIAKSLGRILKLNASQILPLQDYFLLQESQKLETLFKPSEVSNYMTRLVIQINKQNPNIKLRNAQHIRQSVIVNWLKQFNIRQVQYMAGHKNIGSTERYKQEDLTNLTAQLNQFHPLQ